MSNVIADHSAAVLALLNANLVLAGKVFYGKVPDPTPAPPYVVVYMSHESLPGAEGDTLSGESAQITTRIYCHGVGADAIAADAMSYQVRASLLDVVPVIAGRTCGQIYQDASPPPQPDESTGTLVMDKVDMYRFASTPA